MRILAIEREVSNVRDEEYTTYLRAEAARAWELYQAGTIRELYFRTDWPGAVLVLECANAAEANGVLETLPLVQRGLISFDVLPLVAYPGFARLFSGAPA